MLAIVAPHDLLDTTRWWQTTMLADGFGVVDADENDLYAAMDWLLAGGLQGMEAIGLRVGKVVNQYKVATHFSTSMAEMATIVRNSRRTPIVGAHAPTFEIVTTANRRLRSRQKLKARSHAESLVYEAKLAFRVPELPSEKTVV